MAWLLAETAQQPVLAVWEDLHWADPSTLELFAKFPPDLIRSQDLTRGRH